MIADFLIVYHAAIPNYGCVCRWEKVLSYPGFITSGCGNPVIIIVDIRVDTGHGAAHDWDILKTADLQKHS